jgi:CheY-like chemotaxis protein
MSRPRIIILDDDDNIRTVIHVIVQEAVPSAYIIEEASSFQALQHIHATAADLLITDCCMPGMDGPTLVRLLRREHFSLPVIMVSGNPEAQKLGEAAGIDRFIPKIRLNSELPDAVHTFLSNR